MTGRKNMVGGSSNVLKEETKLFYKMTFGQGYSTTTKRIFLCLFLLINVTVQQIPDDITYLSGPSREFTSPGYPRTPPVFVGWNITVDQDHRILLQFLDFELVEMDPCGHDIFELYNGVFRASQLIGGWCWDTIGEFNCTTYISKDNIFFIRLRTLAGHSRRGFKANYTSIPKEVTTTNSVYCIEPTSPSTTTSFQNAMSTSNPYTEATNLTDIPNVSNRELTISIKNTDTSTTKISGSLDVFNSEKVYYIGAGCGILLILCLCCLGVCCCFRRKEKNKTRDSSKSNDTEFQVLAPAGPVQSSQTSHEGSNFSVKSSNCSENDFTGKDNKKSSRPQSVGGAYSSPSYAIPDKKKHEVFENDEDISRQSKVKENTGKSKVPLNTTYATPHGVRPDSTEFEVNVAYQSCDSEKENGSNMTVPVNDEYTYVENTNVITDRPTAAPRVRAGEFKHSSAEKEEDGHEGLIPNLAYQSFDLEDEQVEEQDDEEMTTNVAYQSCDSEEENVGKSDATYYYVDEEGSDKREEQKDIVYESV